MPWLLDGCWDFHEHGEWEVMWDLALASVGVDSIRKRKGKRSTFASHPSCLLASNMRGRTDAWMSGCMRIRHFSGLVVHSAHHQLDRGRHTLAHTHTHTHWWILLYLGMLGHA